MRVADDAEIVASTANPILEKLNAKRILEQYQRATFQALRSGELDEGWLSGWEPEGE